MLSSESVAIVKQTLPALREHGEALTCHMYQRMFSQNPEIQAFFNPAHQHAGTQQRALAAAICAYAEYIDNQAALASAVELIAQKHASLCVKPEHYPTVGKHLLASISEVLGEAASEDVLNAWAEAYKMLADIFIKRESEIYRQHELVHGWQCFSKFVVQKRENASDDIVSFYLRPADGGKVKGHMPGQYITVKIATPESSTTMRNYSLSDSPGKPYYRISVKRESAVSKDAPEGYVSNYLHDHMFEGDSLEIGPPCGEFIFRQPEDVQKKVVFISGGIGITPVLSMLYAALELPGDTRDILFIHCAVNGRCHAFRDEIKQLEAANPRLKAHIRYSRPEQVDREHSNFDSEGLFDTKLLDDLVGNKDADYYFCGPRPMLSSVYGTLKERAIPENNIHYEFFGPAEQLLQE